MSQSRAGDRQQASFIKISLLLSVHHRGSYNYPFGPALRTEPQMLNWEGGWFLIPVCISAPQSGIRLRARVQASYTCQVFCTYNREHWTWTLTETTRKIPILKLPGAFFIYFFKCLLLVSFEAGCSPTADVFGLEIKEKATEHAFGSWDCFSH